MPRRRKRGRPTGSYKLPRVIGDLVWHMQLIVEAMEREGWSADRIRRFRNNKSQMARLLKQKFPKEYAKLTMPRLRQLLQKDYFQRKTVDQMDDFQKRVLARTLGEE